MTLNLKKDKSPWCISLTGDNQTIVLSTEHDNHKGVIHLSHSFLTRIENMENQIVELTKTINELKHIIEYIPGGPIYKKAENEFLILQNSENI